MAFMPVADGGSGAPVGGSVVPFPKVTSNVPSTAPDQALAHMGNMGTPTPTYHGPAINSISHVADSLGANHYTDPSTGLTYVNGSVVKPTSFQNGVGHAPVHTVASAAGYPPAHIQSNPDGTVQVMPKVSATAPDQALTHMGNMGAPNSTTLPTISSPTATAPPQGGGQTPPQYPYLMQSPATQPPAQTPTGLPPAQPTAPNLGLAAGLGAAGLGNVPLSGMNTGGTTLPANTGGGERVGGPGVTTPIAGGGTGNTSAPGTQAPTGAPTGNLNPYWQGVQKAGWLWQAPNPGETTQQMVTRLAQKFGINPNQVQVESNGHARIPFSTIAGYAQSQSIGNPGTGNGAAGGQQDLQSAIQQAVWSYIQSLFGNGGMQMPQYSFDPNQAAQQAFAAENPIYQAQIQAQNQRIMDAANKAGIYNSGWMIQNLQNEDNTLAQNMDNAIQKDISTAQANAEKLYSDQLTGYNDQRSALTGLLPYLSQTANQSATTGINQQRLTDAQLNQAGYAIGPNGNYVPTVTATRDQIAAMQAWAKINGFSVNQDGSITPTWQALNAGGTTYGANGQTTSTVGEQNVQLKAQIDAETQALNQQKLTDSEKAQAFSQWLNTQKLDNATAAQTFTQWLQTQKLDLSTSQQAFTQWLDSTKLTDAEKAQSFKQWLDQQNLDLNQQKFAQQVYAFNHMSAEQKATQAYNYYKTNIPYNSMTVDQKNQLALGYARLNADIQKSAQANAIKLDQVMGVGPNGQPTLDRLKLSAQINQWATTNAQKSVALDIQQKSLNERVAHDTTMAQIAADNASTNIQKTQLSGLHDQLVASGNVIKNLQTPDAQGNVQFNVVDPASGAQKLTFGQEAVANYNHVNGQISTLVQGMGK